jgi:hypothetical protein
VWEQSSDNTYRAGQEVAIRSALASSARARALVLALQTAPSYMAYRIPTADDEDYQYSAEGFELSGWVTQRHGGEGQDSRDPLAATVTYPPPQPSEAVVRLLGLVPDPDMRVWTRDGEPALRTSVWNDTKESGQGRVTGTHGYRLEIRHQDLLDLVAATDQSMIIEVMIDRTHEKHKRQYHGLRSDDDDDSFAFPEQSYKVYLFDAAGGCGEL